MLRRIYAPKREEQSETREDYIMRNFITCTLYKISLE
jgi:hypothetical protein